MNWQTEAHINFPGICRTGGAIPADHHCLRGHPGIREESSTPVSQITRRTARGIEVFDGAYDVYEM